MHNLIGLIVVFSATLFIFNRLKLNKVENTTYRLALILLMSFFICIGENYFSVVLNSYQTPKYVYILDRFEGDFAVLERKDGTIFNVPKEKLSAESKEGDMITEDLKIALSYTKSRSAEIGELYKKIYSKSLR